MVSSMPRALVLAARPKTLTAAVVPIVAASSLAYVHTQQFSWVIFICCLLSATFIQIATNFFNDAIDFKKGADRPDRIGPQRATQSGLLSARTVMSMAIVSAGIAMLFGIPLVIHGGWPIVVIGLVSLILAYGYTGGPFPLAYLGLGDFFVLIFFGWIAVSGVYFLQTGFVDDHCLVLGTQTGILATVLIAINNYRDMHQDKLANKKTLAVRFGEKFARNEIVVLLLLPFVFQVYWILNFEFHLGLLLPFVLLPFSVQLAFGVTKSKPSEELNLYLAKTSFLYLIFGLLFSVGVLGRGFVGFGI
jgi:1,4-dihydroxy-2-naphthoate octaprenyltransferase